MIAIRPISDLRNKFTEIENIVQQGSPIFLTKNGYGSMVVMSLEQYSRLTDPIEAKLDEAEREAESHTRLTHNEVFKKKRQKLCNRETCAALLEAENISKDPNTKKYNNFREAFNDVISDS